MVNKKIIFCVFLILSTIGSINAEVNGEFSLQITSYGAGGSFSKRQTDLEVSLELFNLFFENYILGPFCSLRYFGINGEKICVYIAVNPLSLTFFEK